MEWRRNFLLVSMTLAMVVSSLAASLDDKTVQLNATVSKIVEVLEENSFKGDAGVVPEQLATSGAGNSQEQHPKGRIVPRKGAVMNVTAATTSTPIASTVPKATEAQHTNITTTTTPLVSIGKTNNTIPAGIANATLSNSTASQMMMPTKVSPANATSNSSASPPVAVPSAPKPTTISTSTTSTTTTTTTTTTTKPPKKPKITYSVDDEPKLIQAAKPGYSSQSAPPTISDANGRLHVEEPLAELSKEYIPPASSTIFGGPPRGGHREYVVPVVTLIFAIPLLAGLFLLSYRRAKEFWLTRHYRRMDFLVDGMYNY